tara:strand:+ start:12464 stop:12739 length:276 start_codon:yes stop_codon:yes gene_type:complete
MVWCTLAPWGRARNARSQSVSERVVVSWPVRVPELAAGAGAAAVGDEALAGGAETAAADARPAALGRAAATCGADEDTGAEIVELLTTGVG